MSTDYPKSEEELIWRFTSASASIGFSAQNYDFDIPKSYSTFDTGGALMRRLLATKSASRAKEIDDTLGKLENNDLRVLCETYYPHVPVEYEIMRSAMSLSKNRSSVCLMGLMYRSEVANLARKKNKRENETILDFLRWLATTNNRSVIKKSMDECEIILEKSLQKYDDFRKVRHHG